MVDQTPDRDDEELLAVVRETRKRLTAGVAVLNELIDELAALLQRRDQEDS